MTDPRITKEMIEMLAKRMADTASDWLHNDCGDDEHGLEHSNWEAYTEDAEHALEAVFALLPEPEWVTEDVVSTVELEHAWRDGYFTGKRDYAGSITGGVSISTPNPYSPEGSDRG